MTPPPPPTAAILEDSSSASQQSSSLIRGNPTIGSFTNRQGLTLTSYEWNVRDSDVPLKGVVVFIHGVTSYTQFEFLNHNFTDTSTNSNNNTKKNTKNNSSNNNVTNSSPTSSSSTSSSSPINLTYSGSWPEAFNKAGYAFHCYDQQGHGLSDGWRGDRANVRVFDDFAFDALQYLLLTKKKINSLLSSSSSVSSSNGNFNNNNNTITNETPVLSNNNNNINNNRSSTNKSIPIFLAGISMGGGVVLRTLQLLRYIQQTDEVPNLLLDDKSLGLGMTQPSNSFTTPRTTTRTTTTTNSINSTTSSLSPLSSSCSSTLLPSSTHDSTTTNSNISNTSSSDNDNNNNNNDNNNNINSNNTSTKGRDINTSTKSNSSSSIFSDDNDNDNDDINNDININIITAEACQSLFISGLIALAPNLSLKSVIRSSFINRVLFPLSGPVAYLFPHAKVAGIAKNVLYPMIDEDRAKDVYMYNKKMSSRMANENVYVGEKVMRDIYLLMDNNKINKGSDINSNDESELISSSISRPATFTSSIVPQTSILIVHSKNDTMCDPIGSIELYEELNREGRTEDVSLWLLDDMWHYLIIEPNNNILKGRVLNWMNERLIKEGVGHIELGHIGGGEQRGKDVKDDIKIKSKGSGDSNNYNRSSGNSSNSKL